MAKAVQKANKKSSPKKIVALKKKVPKKVIKKTTLKESQQKAVYSHKVSPFHLAIPVHNL